MKGYIRILIENYVENDEEEIKLMEKFKDFCKQNKLNAQIERKETWEQ